MQLNERDLAYLLDMLTACEDVLEFASDVPFQDFATDKMRKLATERQLEVLGVVCDHSVDQQEWWPCAATPKGDAGTISGCDRMHNVPSSGCW